MRIGFFPKFKNSDCVLLSGTALEITNLSAQLVDSSVLKLHEVATVSIRHPVQLLASRQANRAVATWVFSSADIEKLGALAQTGKGHQYFELTGSTATFMVSVGEYDDTWWSAHG